VFLSEPPAVAGGIIGNPILVITLGQLPATAGGSDFTCELLINAAGEKSTIHYQNFARNEAGRT
jgi:hypothetical protein